MYPIISNIIFLVLGVMFGVFVMCLMTAAGRADRETELMENSADFTKELEATDEEG